MIIFFLLNFKATTKNVLYDLGKVSFAIYFMHLLVMKLVGNILLKLDVNKTSFFSEIFIGLTTISISYIICITLRKFDADNAKKYLGI